MNSGTACPATNCGSAFKLKHNFDDKGTPKRGTPNLMDYLPAGNQATDITKTATLRKYQWDEIISPRLIAFGWSEEWYAEENNKPPKEKGVKEAQSIVVKKQTKIDTYYGYQTRTDYITWIWHFKREPYPSFKRLNSNEGYWVTENTYCSSDEHIKYVGAAIAVLSENHDFRFQQSHLDNDKRILSEFFYPEDNVIDFLKIVKRSDCQDQIQDIIQYQEIASGKLEETTFIFDLLTFIPPAAAIKSGNAILKFVQSFANTKNIISGIKGITSGVILFKSVEGKVLQSTDEILEYSFKEGKELVLESGSREIARLSQRMINPVNYADETGEVIARQLSTTIDDTGKEITEVFEIIKNEKGLLFRKTISGTSKKIWDDILIQGKKGIKEVLSSQYKTIDEFLESAEYISKVNADFVKYQARGGKLNLEKYIT